MSVADSQLSLPDSRSPHDDRQSAGDDSASQGLVESWDSGGVSWRAHVCKNYPVKLFGWTRLSTGRLMVDER
jgi:hypothetical protein